MLVRNARISNLNNYHTIKIFKGKVRQKQCCIDSID